MYGEIASAVPDCSYSDSDSRREGFTVGMSDKFNEIKDKVAENADDLKDKAGDLYNKAKESPAGEKIDDVADSVKEKAQGAAGKFKGDRRAE